VSGGGLRRKVVEMCRRSMGACSIMWCKSEQKALVRRWGRTGQRAETESIIREGAAGGKGLEYVHRACEYFADLRVWDDTTCCTFLRKRTVWEGEPQTFARVSTESINTDIWDCFWTRALILRVVQAESD